MRNPAQSYRNTTRATPMLSALSVEQDLSLKHDYGLVHIWVGVERGRLAPYHLVLQQDERPVGLLRGRLHGPQTSAGKPKALALSLPLMIVPAVLIAFS